MRVEVIVKYRNGLAVWNNGAPGPVRRQIPWDAGDLETEAQALAVAQSVYEQKEPRRRSYEVTTAVPAYWPRIGDGVTTVDMNGVTPVTSRVRTRRVSVRSGGYALAQPTLGSPSEELLERQQIALKRQSNSTQSSGTSPVAGQLGGSFISGGLTGPSIATWSFDPIGESWSALVEVTEDAVVPKILYKLDATTKDPTQTNANSATTLAAQLSVVIVQTPPRPSIVATTIPAGRSEWSIMTGMYVHAGDTVQAVITDTFTNDIADLEFKKLTVQLVTAPGLLVRRDPVEKPNPTR